MPALKVYVGRDFEVNGFFTAIFRPNPEVRARAAAGAEDQVGTKSGLSRKKVTPEVPRKYPASTPQVIAILAAASEREAAREELQYAAGVKDREHFRKEYLKPLLTSGLLEMSIPDKPRSSKQRYRLTQAGTEYLKKTTGKK